MTMNVAQNEQALKPLFEGIARNLTGRRCVVRFEEPKTPGAYGEASILSSGKGLIVIKPGYPPQEQYYYLLHEAAHIKLNHPAKPYPVDVFARARIEAEATQLCDRWYDLAKQERLKANTVYLPAPTPTDPRRQMRVTLSVRMLAGKK
jgi:hypothetical protein